VVVLDIEPSIGLRRIRSRGEPDRLERESLPFHDRVRYAFLDQATADPRRYLVLDATLPPDVIADAVLQRVGSLPAMRRDALGSDVPRGRPDDPPTPPPTIPAEPDNGYLELRKAGDPAYSPVDAP
jgi:dTMP kinase